MSDKLSPKQKAKLDAAIDASTDKASETYYAGLNKIGAGHKPAVAKSRLFVAGLIVGVVLTAAFFILVL